MFIEVPIYDSDSNSSANEILNTDNFVRIKDNGNVPIDPGAVDTPSIAVTFPDGSSEVIILTYDDIKTRLSALVGVTSDTGDLS